MVKFLIHRPIAVLITALAISILGIIMVYQLPVSLMPDIEIPEITVQINRKKQAAKELERSVVGPLRRELLQVPYLQDIESRVRDGIGIIKLRFDYGASIDYAFLDVNEQIDAAMARLPRELERPNVIKASATDLPVFFLNVSYKSALDSLISEDRYLELSEFSEEIIRKRLEQLGEVALVDITGTQYPEIQIQPDLELLQNLGISENSLKQLLEEHNIDLGNLIVREGKYQYNIRFSSFLRSTRDIAELYLKVDDRVLQLKELAEVRLIPQKRVGAYFSNGKQAIGMAIIKQADARIADLEEEVKFLVEVFQDDYPELEFSLSQDQSKLLNYSIQNLGQSLLIGSMLAFVILFLFLQNARSPWLIGISIPFSLLLSLLLFYFLKISINIISLSGLILGIGLMIDNAIIVIDNISQQIERGLSLDEACVKGTNEVIRPLISSTLTTSAVFIPLIFLSGISGALFWDQALAVSIGLGSSLLVSITLLPTLFRLILNKQSVRDKKKSTSLLKLYEKGLAWVFKYPLIFLALVLVLMMLGGLILKDISVRQLPEVAQQELQLNLDWNEDIQVKSQLERVDQLRRDLSSYYAQIDAQIGSQNFLLNPEPDKGTSELKIYMEAEDPQALDLLHDTLSSWLNLNYPAVPFSIHPPPTIFERLFANTQAPILLKLSRKGSREVPDLTDIYEILRELEEATEIDLQPIPEKTLRIIEADLEKLALYGVDIRKLYQRLQTDFRSNQITSLLDQKKEIPVLISGAEVPISDILSRSQLENEEGVLIPVSALIEIKRTTTYTSIFGDRVGTFVPIGFQIEEGERRKIESAIQEVSAKHPTIDFNVEGALYEGEETLIELSVVILIALLMLYFILAAQFESLSQPLIVLLEVPIDLAAAIIFLWLGASSLNLMSMIGMIVMSGIIINDSILKIDTINQLRREGLGLMEAIHEGGRRRLIPIIMTSLTTILAVLPFFFGSGLGVDLQKPLALALIGGMLVGTLVSLYFIPLAYYYLHKKREKY